MKRLATFLICYAKALNVRGPKSERHVPCHKSSTAVKTPNLWLPNKLLATLASYNKITLHTVTTKLLVTVIGFDIWNFIFVLSAMYQIQYIMLIDFPTMVSHLAVVVELCTDDPKDF